MLGSLRFHLGRLSLLDDGLRVLGSFARLRRELLDDGLVASFGLQSESTSLSLQAFDLDLVVRKLVLAVWLDVVLLLARHHLEELAVLDVDSQALWYEEAEPLQCLLVESRLREHVLPVGYAEVHDHQAEVVGEAVGHVVPLAGEVLEPDLRLLVRTAIEQSYAAILSFRVNLERVAVLLDGIAFLLRFAVRALFLIRDADPGEAEALTLDSLDVSQLVEVHVAQLQNLL